MKAMIQDKAAIGSLQPLDMVSYLHAKGWQETDHVDDYSSTWTLPMRGGRGYEILLPLRASFADYAARMADALHVLAVAEDRSELDIIADLFATSADFVKIRSFVSGAEDGTIPLTAGVELVENASNLFTFAACAAVERRAIYSNRRPQEVMDYVRGLRLGQTERGSYIVTIASPVPPYLSPTESGMLFESKPAPFPRRVVLTLARSLRAMHAAAQRSAVTRDMEPWAAAVDNGISSNLCDAVVKLTGQGSHGNTEVNFVWSLHHPLEEAPPSRVSFTPDTIGYIAEASTWLRRNNPIIDTEIQGPVIELARSPMIRDDDDNATSAVVLTIIDDKTRRVTLDLTDQSRDIAIRAFREKLSIKCSGTLVRSGRSYTLRSASELTIIDD